MKKTFSFILALICISLMPLYVFADGGPSPTIESLYWTEPSLQIQLIKTVEEANEYLALINTYYDLDGFNEMVLGTDQYEILDIVIVTLDKEYTSVIWHMPYEFHNTDNISIFMISTDLLNGYVMNGYSNNNLDLTVNYAGVAPGMYFMLVYVAH